MIPLPCFACQQALSVADGLCIECHRLADDIAFDRRERDRAPLGAP